MKKLNIIKFGLISGLIFIPSASALTKNETVYSKLNYDGTVSQTKVINQIVTSEESEIEDDSELLEILNISGKETLSVKGRSLKWQANGKDIFYSGETSKDPLIQTDITYFLDGEELNVSKMVGKSGHVKINYHFTNNNDEVVLVNGVREKVKIPFVVTLGTMMDASIQNVSITNGKSISNGDKVILVGISSPGLASSLNLSDLKSLDDITIEFDTDSFALSQVYVVMTPKFLSESDLDIFDSLNSLYSSIDTLKESMDKIEEGVSSLSDGSSKLVLGADTLATSLKTVKSNVTLLKNGSVSLDNGLKTLLESLENAKVEVSKAIPDTTELTTLKDSNTKAISTLTEANKQVVSKLTQFNSLAYTNYTMESLTSMSEADIQALLGSEVVVGSGVYYDASMIENLITIKKTYEGNVSLITLLTYNNKAIDSTLENLNSISLKITSMIDLVSGSVEKIESGASNLSSNLSKLETGIKELSVGADSLASGVSLVDNGAKTLHSGVSKLNKEGISVFVNYKNRLKDYSNKLEAMVELSDSYSGYTSNNATTTTFVYTISSLKK